MRFLAIAILGLAVGCGSTLGTPDGGGGTSGGGAGGAGGGAACVYNGETYRPGSIIPSGDCNTCTCAAGQIACTLIACPPDGPCVFDTTYRYGDTGGLVAYEDTATLAPPASYSYERTSHVTTPPSSSCSPALPACGVFDLWNPMDIMRAFADPDVQAALAMATPPTYGRDARPVDGTIFQLLRADGHGFLVGYACAGGSQPGGCVDAPIGITRLVNLLRELDEQQLRDPSCAALR